MVGMLKSTFKTSNAAGNVIFHNCRHFHFIDSFQLAANLLCHDCFSSTNYTIDDLEVLAVKENSQLLFIRKKNKQKTTILVNSESSLIWLIVARIVNGVTSSGCSYYHSSKGGTQYKEHQRQVNGVQGQQTHILFLSRVKPKVKCELF